MQWQAEGFVVRDAEKVATTLAGKRTDAELSKTLATLVGDLEVGDVASWKWSGARDDAESVLERSGATPILDRLRRLTM
jgi:hypothetical protein